MRYLTRAVLVAAFLLAGSAVFHQPVTTVQAGVPGNAPMLAPTAENHGLNISWGASPSAASCFATGTPPCVASYLVYTGTAGAGSEGSAPVAVSGLAYTLDGATMNQFLGETVCAYVAFQEVIGTLTLTSANSGEACFSFPTTPSAPATPALSAH